MTSEQQLLVASTDKLTWPELGLVLVSSVSHSSLHCNEQISRDIGRIKSHVERYLGNPAGFMRQSNSEDVRIIAYG